LAPDLPSHGLPGQRPGKDDGIQSSRKVRAKASVKGRKSQPTAVCSPVRTNTSAGIPGFKGSPLNAAGSVGGKATRAT